MQLSNYISDLLYRYECVIIPGFGAFLTRIKSAQIDEDTGMFTPPSKLISFNKQLQTNDGLLANYVAGVEHIPYEMALKQIRAAAFQMTADLQAGKPVILDRIGVFSVTEENRVQFEPSEKENYYTAAFGLSSFILPKIGRTAETKEPAVIPLRTEIKAQRPYLKYAAIAVIALMSAGFGGMKVYENEVQNQNFAERQKANTLVDKKIQEATFVIENPLPALNLHLSKQTGKYHLVAGAYKIEENAEIRMNQLREAGYKPFSVPSKYGFHQVIYESFETRNDAVKKLFQIKNFENPDAWLLVQDLE